MTVTVNANGLSIAHLASNGISTATVPDVCKTPSPGGPVPIPYPNISMSSTLSKGTTTVTADGGNMIAINGSQYSTSSGDEPGTIGGVTSSTFKMESTWITYSFNVKMDGSPVCRLTDKKFQNHKNTVDCAGNIQAPVVGGSGGAPPAPAASPAAPASSPAAPAAPPKPLSVEPFDPVNGEAFNALSSPAEQRAFLTEYAKQVSAQEKAINSLTVDQYLQARAQYYNIGRNPAAKKAQTQFANAFEAMVRDNIYDSLISDSLRAGRTVDPPIAKALEELAAQQAAEIRSGLDALHEPDMVAGGYLKAVPTRMGSSSVNEAIGPSWKGRRVQQMDDWAAIAVKDGHGSSQMNVILGVSGTRR
jgi:hypothetical protein